jgi:hypothetical protein
VIYVDGTSILVGFNQQNMEILGISSWFTIAKLVEIVWARIRFIAGIFVVHIGFKNQQT